jgi:hypothetical protein
VTSQPNAKPERGVRAEVVRVVTTVQDLAAEAAGHGVHGEARREKRLNAPIRGSQ